MSETSQVRTPKDPGVRLTRRKVLCVGPSALIATAMPAVWHPAEAVSASVVKPSSAERIDAFVSGCNVGLISASLSDLTLEENQRRCSGLWPEIQRRFGSIDVEVRFTEKHGPFLTRNLMERGYLLIGKKGFDSGNLKGFLRQYGAICDQRFVLHKPYDESAYFLSTRAGRKQPKVCVGEITASRLPDYFRLIREQGSSIDVQSMRFPIRKTFFSRLGGEY